MHGKVAADRERVGAVKDIAGACGIDDIDGIGGRTLQAAVLRTSSRPPPPRVTATTRQLKRASVASASSLAEPAKPASAGSENTA